MQKGKQVGPYRIEDVQGWIKAGYVKMEDPAWFEGCEDWVSVKRIPGVEEVEKGQVSSDQLVTPFEAYQGDEPYLFISYAHKDSAEVFREISALNEAGYRIWYDEGIEASTEWPEEIANAVLGCSLFLVFVSPRSTSSVNCRNEINLALNEDKPFLAVHLEESVLPPGLRLRMGDLQAILRYKLPKDRYDKKLYDALDQLLGKKKRRAETRGVSTSPIQSSQTSQKIKLEKTNKVSAPKKKSRFGLFASVVLALGLIGYAAFQFLTTGKIGIDRKNQADEGVFSKGQPWTVQAVGMEMIWCPPGKFVMGSPSTEEGRNEDEVRREVRLTQGFYLGKYEVKQEEWNKVMGVDPSKFKGENHPVESVSWDQCYLFCQKITFMERKAGKLPEGWVYDMPSEAQWEYACRAGTDQAYPWGDSSEITRANYYDGEIKQTTAVGSYGPNSWGFYDMIGNVAEWCADKYSIFSTTKVSDPLVLKGDENRVTRGNSWFDDAEKVRLARRVARKQGEIDQALGFRLCLRQFAKEEGSIPTMDTEKTGIHSGLVGWWKFDETTGLVAKDSSGYERDGELTSFDSSSVHWIAGPVGNALSFDGVDDFIKISGYKGIVGSKPRSIACWIKTAHLEPSILTWGSEETSGKWFFGLQNELLGNKSIAVGIGGSQVLSDQVVDSGWNHLVMVLPDGQNSVRNLLFYVNGNPIGLNYINAMRSIDTEESVDLLVGKDAFGLNSNFYGAMDDLRIYKRAISQKEIMSLYEIGNPPTLFIPDLTASIPDSRLRNGLVGWWKFDESEGRKAMDSSGMFRHGTLNGFSETAEPWEEGNLKFDGIDDYVEVESFKWGGEVTIAGWVKYESFENSSRVVDFGNGPSKQNLTILQKQDSATLEFSNFSLDSSQSIEFPDFWELNKWVHFTCMITPAGQGIIFKNGQLAMSVQRGVTAEIFRRNQYFGRSNWTSDSYFKGQLDDLRIYDRVLSRDEVHALFEWNEETESEPELESMTKTLEPDVSRGLVGWWKFDETTGRLARDSSGKNRDGSLVSYSSATDQWSRGPVGNALSFDGKDDNVDLGNFIWGGECSVAGWVKMDSESSWSRILEFGDRDGKNNVLIANADEFTTFRFENWIEDSNQVSSTRDFWKLREWIHFACMVDSKGTTTVYKNGNLSFREDHSPTSSTYRSNQFLGKSNWSESAYFHGQMDDFRIYDRALSDVEVKEIHSLGDLTGLVYNVRKKGVAGFQTEKESIYSDELLAAVNDWKLIPRSVFPLSGVKVMRNLQLELYADNVLSARTQSLSTKELLALGEKGYILTQVDQNAVPGISTKLVAGKELIVHGAKGNALTVSTSANSRLKGFLKMEDTDFKDRVAKLFEIRKGGK